MSRSLLRHRGGATLCAEGCQAVAPVGVVVLTAGVLALVYALNPSAARTNALTGCSAPNCHAPQTAAVWEAAGAVVATVFARAAAEAATPITAKALMPWSTPSA